MNIRHLPSKLILLFSSAAVALLLIELAYRVFLFGPAAFSIRKVNSAHDIGISGLIQPSPHQEIAYELKPNLDTIFKLVPFRTNSKGLRDREIPVEKPPGVFRICVVGDSMTLPAGVAIEDAWHKVLETRLNQRGSATPVETVNFGVGGYYLRQYLGVIHEKAALYRPDLVIVAFCAQNDHWLPPGQLFDRPYRVLPKTHPFFESFALDTARRIYSHLLRRFRGQATWVEKGTEERTAVAQEQPATGVYTAAEESYLVTQFGRLASYSREAGVPVVVVNLFHQHNAAYSAELDRLVRAAGLPFADVTSAFQGTNVMRFRIYPTDNHPNAAGHAIFGETIERALVGQKLIPE